MIAKRIGTALRARDWTAVAIEFAVVVLGIFIALQAQDWNQGRMDRRVEQAYIARLIDETRANIETLNEQERIFEEKVEFILALPDLALDARVRRDPQEFMDWLDYSTWKALPNLRSETYRELESSGRLLLLRDARLRTAIAGSVADYAVIQSVLSEPIGDYRRLLLEALPGRSYYDYRAGAGTADIAAIVSSLEAFRGDARFEAAANAEVSYGADMIFWIRDFRQRSEHILSLLQAAE